MNDFPWPIPPGMSDLPTWLGNGFRVGRETVAILSYEPPTSGWTNALTTFHEETAGTTHFVDRASRARALSQLQRFLDTKDAVILDVGCSSGFMLADLRVSFPEGLVIGSDVVREPLENLAVTMRGCPLLHFDLVKCPLPDANLDAIVLLNVLEHIADDVVAMSQVHRILKPGGIAVIEVPAGPELYDVYDKLLLHHRRYTLRGLRTLCAAVGLQVVNASHLGFFLYPGFRVVKQRNKRFLKSRRPSQEQVVARSITGTRDSRLFDWLMKVELYLGRSLQYPFGIRCVITCRKGF